MKKIIERFVNDIKLGENIDLYITLSLSLVLAIFGAIGVIQVSILSAGILATLSTHAYSMLATRRTLIDFSEDFASLRSTENVPFKSRRGYKPFRDLIADTSTLWLFGPSLINVWPPHQDLLLKKVRSGGELRIMVFNPMSVRLPILAEQIGRSPESLKIDIIKTLEECKAFICEGFGSGRFEVRLTEMLPGYNMVICDSTQSKGYMTVEFFGYRSSLNDRPHIELSVSRNRDWFDHYLNEYDELWKSAIPYDIGSI